MSGKLSVTLLKRPRHRRPNLAQRGREKHQVAEQLETTHWRRRVWAEHCKRRGNWCVTAPHRRGGGGHKKRARRRGLALFFEGG